MKKLSGFLVAALLVGVASAFTTQAPKQQTVAWGYDGATWHMVNEEDINLTYLCNSGSDYCLYDEPNGNPLEGQVYGWEFFKIP